MAVPKKKTSKTRRDKRRTHDKLKKPNAHTCPQCQEPVLRHNVCGSCGFYRGKEVLNIEEI
ncbi:MAG: 50S ribosomal protein L32 [Deltaproteobacteria bacterium]|nr:50S ribosomal protein L32 [Deltaproteobacteria bacterium]